MTNEEIVQDLLRRVPDDASLEDIARELEFIAAVRQGVAELDNGDSVAIDEVEQELPSWIIMLVWILCLLWKILFEGEFLVQRVNLRTASAFTCCGPDKMRGDHRT